MIINSHKIAIEKPFHFEFTVYQEDLHEYSIESEGRLPEIGIQVKGTLNKVDKKKYFLSIAIIGSLTFPCSRCLEATEYTCDYNLEETIQLEESTELINIIDYVEDMFFINEPSRILCEESCKGLCVECGVNLNREKCSCDTSADIDPRMAALKNLL